jgi:hypothetical protein
MIAIDLPVRILIFSLASEGPSTHAPRRGIYAAASLPFHARATPNAVPIEDCRPFGPSNLSSHLSVIFRFGSLPGVGITPSFITLPAWWYVLRAI